MEIAMTLLLLTATVAAVAYPLWRPQPEPPEAPIGPAARLEELEDQKQLVYASIRELGLDLRTGRVTEADYRTEVSDLKEEAVELVRQIEALKAETPRGPDSIETEVRRALERLAAPPAPSEDPAGDRYCTQCGRRADPDDRFCSGCGTRLLRPDGPVPADEGAREAR